MMKAGTYYAVLFMAILCVLLTVALVIMGYNNQQLQIKLQAQQQVLNQGVLGQQAQQISSALLQNMADVAADNLEIRQLMEKHGYRITPAKDTDPAPKVNLNKSGSTSQKAKSSKSEEVDK